MLSSQHRKYLLQNISRGGSRDARVYLPPIEASAKEFQDSDRGEPPNGVRMSGLACWAGQAVVPPCPPLDSFRGAAGLPPGSAPWNPTRSPRLYIIYVQTGKSCPQWNPRGLLEKRVGSGCRWKYHEWEICRLVCSESAS